jgi:hypothetical protein
MRDKLYNSRERMRQLLATGKSDIPVEDIYTDASQVINVQFYASSLIFFLPFFLIVFFFFFFFFFGVGWCRFWSRWSSVTGRDGGQADHGRQPPGLHAPGFVLEAGHPAGVGPAHGRDRLF